MANFNRKGPKEEGSKTGRGLGKCNKENTISEDWYDKAKDGEGYHQGRCSGKQKRNKAMFKTKGRGRNQGCGRGKGRGKGRV